MTRKKNIFRVISKNLQQQNALLGPTQYSASIIHNEKSIQAIATANRNSFTSADGKEKNGNTNVLSILLIYIITTLYNISICRKMLKELCKLARCINFD